MTREEAIKYGKEQLEIFGGMHRKFITMAIEALQAEPKHGKWIYDGKKIKGGIEWVHCSNCGQKGDAKSILMKHGNYCPNCGAKMDKE